MPPTHGFMISSTAMKNVWLSMEHQAIMWCNQLVVQVSEIFHLSNTKVWFSLMCSLSFIFLCRYHIHFLVWQMPELDNLFLVLGRGLKFLQECCIVEYHMISTGWCNYPLLNSLSTFLTRIQKMTLVLYSAVSNFVIMYPMINYFQSSLEILYLTSFEILLTIFL